MSMSERLALIGTGVMGTALLAALPVGRDGARDVVVVDAVPGRAAAAASAHGVRAAAEIEEAVSGAGVVVLAVKPGDVAASLARVGPALEPEALVVSVAAGVPCAYYEDRLPEGTPVVRVMPNTPALVGQGMSAVAPGQAARDGHLARVESLLAGTGAVVRVSEQDMDAVTAISGSGPAYVFYVIDALAEAGVLLGLGRGLATRLATQTVLGSAALVGRSGEHPAVLRERVSSPGGTTVAALRRLDAAGVRAAFVDAAEAAARRAGELSRELTGESPGP